MSTPTHRPGTDEYGDLGRPVGLRRLAALEPDVAPLAGGSSAAYRSDRERDEETDDVIRELVPEIGQRRIREEAARDARFRMARELRDWTESEKRLAMGDR